MPKTVMIVEDNELNMKLFNDLLESRGYSIIQTRNGMEAIGLARAHHPDLILMDIQLPIMDGYVATRRIKADPALRPIPVIAVTSYALSGDEEKARAAGCDDFVPKPYSPRQLLAKIRQYLPVGHPVPDLTLK
jgi:two-component system, cell cycle response regulator DivK